jgi:hypothetical protein
MFYGKYKVYLDGKLVAEKENSITRAGRSIILKSLMGLIPNIGGSIQIGIDNTTNGTIDLDSPSATTSGTATTYTTRYNHQYRVGDVVSMSGTGVTAYNLSNRTIQTVPSATTFTILSGGVGAITPRTNAVTAVAPVSTSIAMTNFIGNATTTVTGTSTADHGLIAGDIITISGAGNSATISTTSGTTTVYTYNTSAIHGLSAGSIVSITGNSVSSYNRTNATIATVPTPTSFTINVSGTAPAVGAGGTVSSQQFRLNGTWTIASAPTTTTFTFIVSSAPTSATLTTGIGTTSTVRSNTYTATGHPFSVGNSVTISGSSVAGYNGTFTIASAATDTFTVLNKTITTPVTWTSGLATSRNSIVLTSPTVVPGAGMAITGTNIASGSTISAVTGTGPYVLTLSSLTSGTVSGDGTMSSSGTGTNGQVALVTSADGLIPNDRLGFSVGSSPVTLSFLDNLGSFDAMVFKTSVSATGQLSEAFKIHELGLFPYNLNNVVQKQTTLFSGSAADGWINESTPLSLGNSLTTSAYIDSSVTTYPFRVGDTALFLFTNQAIVSNTRLLTIGDNVYGQEDYLSLAVSKAAGTTPTILIRFYTNDLSYYTFTYTTLSADTYKIISRRKSQAVTTGSPSWSNIQKVQISSTSPCAIDAIRFNDNNSLDTTQGMVSRTTLDQPILKTSNQELDIEYYLSLTFNKTVT